MTGGDENGRCNGLTWRRAEPADASVLEAWDRDPDVIAARGGDPEDPDDPDDWSEELRGADPHVENWIAEEAGRPVGYVQLIDPALEASHYWGSHPTGERALDIWLGAPADRGRGLGTVMMRWAIARAFADPAVRAIVIDPLATNERAIAFYRRLGFVQQGERTFDDGTCCLVMRLPRSTWNASG